eukprot:10768011-Alexandrium_andersonii.AAC.1
MSASLVGSEMCIRDRGAPARDLLASAPACPARAPATGGAPGPRAANPGRASRTFLRAGARRAQQPAARGARKGGG